MAQFCYRQTVPLLFTQHFSSILLVPNLINYITSYNLCYLLECQSLQQPLYAPSAIILSFLASNFKKRISAFTNFNANWLSQRIPAPFKKTVVFLKRYYSTGPKPAPAKLAARCVIKNIYRQTMGTFRKNKKHLPTCA